MKIRATVFFLLLSLPSPLWAVALTGNTNVDFPPEACQSDPSGKNLPLPSSFPPNRISGFDVDQICLLYDAASDTLFAGIKTFDNPTTGRPIPFGDADGDGNPSSTSDELLAEGGTDFADLASEEYFSLIFDLDNTLTTPPDIIAGVSAERSAPSGFRVAAIALPHLGLSFSFSNLYYGDLIPAAAESRIFASPSATLPHLEFTVTGFSKMTKLSALSLSNPDDLLLLIFKAGSLGDTSIGEEDVRYSLRVDQFSDSDNDLLPDFSDTDKDNDGIPDITEQRLNAFDLNSDCRLSAAEIAASGLDKDGDGDIDVNDSIDFPDTDRDGVPDYLDTDSDGDTILDLDEANTAAFDTNGDRKISPTELANIDVGGNYPGGNGNGCLQASELPDTDSDATVDFQDLDSDGDTIPDAVEAGDSNPATPPVNSDGDDHSDFRDTDSDNDGLPDHVEISVGTNPADPDTDGDGVSDGDEIAQGRDPLTPGPGVDPDINIPNSGQVIQIQGSGPWGCSLIR